MDAKERYCVAVIAVLAVPLLLFSGIASSRTVHLPGKITRNAEVGLAIVAPDTLYAAYWAEAQGNQPWRLQIYKLSISTEKTTAEIELERAQPLRSRNGDAIQTPVRLSISPDGSTLLASAVDADNIDKVWTLSSDPLHVLSTRRIPADAHLFGFNKEGNVRLLQISGGGSFGQEIVAGTVLDLKPRALDKTVFEKTIRFREPAWALTSVGPDNLLSVLNERTGLHGEKRITAYNLQTGKDVATYQVTTNEAEGGVRPREPRPRSADLPAPTAIPQADSRSDAPQLSQILATHQALLGAVDQPVTEWQAWSRVMRVGLDNKQPMWSSPLNGCDLTLEKAGHNGRIAIGTCQLIGRVLFLDLYAIKKLDAVFVLTQTGAITSVLPLNVGVPLSLAIDDSVSPALVAIYDRRATLRVVSISDK